MLPISLNSNCYDPTEYFDWFNLQHRYNAGLNTTGEAINLKRVSLSDLRQFVEAELGPCIFYALEKHLYVHNEDKSVLVTASENGEMVTVNISGDPDRVQALLKAVATAHLKAPVYIKWIYDNDGDSIKLPVDTDRIPRTEFYPQLAGEELTSYYDRFITSKANILVLIGPPGTGKTSFLKGLLYHTSRNAIVSYDPSILEKDGIFASFLSGREDVMILEDADNFLGSRSRGNTVMHRFLNIGDGLISTSGKKIIFTTNLPSVRDVDSALLRPGRCFDILKFRALTAQEAAAVDPAFVSAEGGDVSLAQIFNPGERSSTVGAAPVGFHQ